MDITDVTCKESRGYLERIWKVVLSMRTVSVLLRT